MSEENVQLNVKREKFVVRLTEWEQDCILQCMQTGMFPGNMVPLAHGLIEKIKNAEEVKDDDRVPTAD